MSCGHVVFRPGCDWCEIADETRRQRDVDAERLRLDRQRLAVEKETLRLQREAALSAQSDRNEALGQRRAAQDQAQQDAAAAAEARRSRRAKERYSTLRPLSARERWAAAGGAAAVTATVLWFAATNGQAGDFVVGGALALLVGWLYLRWRRGGWWLVRSVGGLDVTLIGISFGISMTSGRSTFSGPSASITPGQVVGILFVAVVVGGLAALLARTPGAVRER